MGRRYYVEIRKGKLEGDVVSVMSKAQHQKTLTYHMTVAGKLIAHGAA
jgi:hypothetical protein